VSVVPPVPGATCGASGLVTELVLAERYLEDDLAQLADRAIVVYVCTILNHAAVERGVISPEDIHLVAWAEVARRPELLPTQRP
jgi:hypothetical protein